MEMTNKSMLEGKKRIIESGLIAFLACVGCAALFLGIYSVIDGKYVFAIIYLLALILCFLYVIMKINTVMPTFIANDSENVYMRYWENGIFPFKTEKGFLGEFIPEKVKNSKIAMTGIKSITVGSAKFISRALPESGVAKKLDGYNQRHKKMIRRLEFIHIVLINGKEKYMPVSDFDLDALAEIIKAVRDAQPEVTINSGNRKIRKSVTVNSLQKGKNLNEI